MFLKIRLTHGETTVSYATRLREKSPWMRLRYYVRWKNTGAHYSDNWKWKFDTKMYCKGVDIIRISIRGWTHGGHMPTSAGYENIITWMRHSKSGHLQDWSKVNTIIKNSPTRKYRTQQCCHCGSARVHADMKDCPAYGKSAINVEN